MYEGQNLPPLVQRYAKQPPEPPLSYATVRDFCDSVDAFPWLGTHQNDLKDAERPWTVKAILKALPPGSRLLEIGSGEPLAAATLVSFGYDVTICDPFDGSGNGPVEFEAYQAHYPGVRFIRALFTPDLALTFTHQFDGIFSISVLEHVIGDNLRNVFAATDIALKAGGYSIHAVDHVLEGNGDSWHADQVLEILKLQDKLTGDPLGEPALAQEFRDLLKRASGDLETFYLSPQGHNSWRGTQPYDTFPFRKCIAVQSVVRRLAPQQWRRAG